MQEAEAIRVGVKELAEFVHRRGDIHYRYENSALAQEGIARQQAYQRGKPASYQTEVPVKASLASTRLSVTGRVDGWDPDGALVEEIKTTRADAPELHARIGSVNSAQLKLYGAMLALAEPGIDALLLRLVYLHPDNPGEFVVEERLSRPALVGFFEETATAYAQWLAETEARLSARDAALRAARFPYGRFRPDQRRIARTLYRGFRDAADWLVEAPTGMGKTIASVFPAVKAMGEGHLDRVVFVTSRNTGQRAAEGAFRDAVGAVGTVEKGAVAVTITAKERVCFNPSTPCDPDRCEFARGYYDRMPAARRDVLGGGVVDRAAVEAAARAHRVCPFELSLDAAAWADAVIGDYNYVFDPVIRLKRLDNVRFRRVALIVDEAHQLGDRVRDMLGKALDRSTVKAALAEPGLPAVLAKGLRSVDRALGRISGAAPSDDRDSERVVPWPDALERAIDRFLAAVARTPLEADALPAARVAHFDLLRFRRACDWATDGAFHCIASGTGRRLRIEVVCTVPGSHIQEIVAPFHGTARLSGTLTPAPVFQAIHGFPAEADALAAHGLAFEEQLGVLVVPDVRTHYRDRSRTMRDLARLIDEVAVATPGNVLVAFPSFAYAHAAAAASDRANVRCQEADMTLSEREDFIDWINEPDADHVAFVVMGGVFAESVDYDSRALRTVVVVGPGLPPPSLGRDLIARDSLAITDDGFEIAYRQPAMTRVVQAVGRIARGEHRGTAVLVDPRFGDPANRAFMPSWWQPRFVQAQAAARHVAGFWT